MDKVDLAKNNTENIQVTCKPLNCKTHFIPTKLAKQLR